SLNNGGETLELSDPNGESILLFTYLDTWSDKARLEGHSLVITDITANYDAWELAETWKESSAVMGSPGRAEPTNEVPGNTYEDWYADYFTAEEREDAAISGPLADANGDGY